ncbi:hypothetical protein QEJ31_10800 [Pigmentibacter sp. JX0631]|uniref:hypothetical protein n=1 Tax=Pigmentibacter sp. JX0631 TaxID=2976982 RepID=UPI0024696214|nr:hypothetical protein [Pigmentibacter sp. JX0631]WGL59008.1 hypothetical protein QEJ31_10800 [Pigmentibacter sp. JX0631]
MKLNICNLSVFSLTLPFLFSCGNAVDNRRKQPKANENVNLPKQEHPNKEIHEFEKKITELTAEKEKLKKVIEDLEKSLLNSNSLQIDYKNKIKELIDKTKSMLEVHFKLENDTNFDGLIEILNGFNSIVDPNNYNFDNLFTALTNYFIHYFLVTYKDKINAEVTPIIYELLDGTNKLVDSNKITESKENITEKIINGNIGQIIEEINLNIKNININLENKKEAEKLAEKNKLLKIIKDINLDGEKLFPNKRQEDLKKEIEKEDFIIILNKEINRIIIKIKEKNKSDILKKLGIPSNEYNTFKLNEFEKKIRSGMETNFKKEMLDYLVKKNIIKKIEDKESHFDDFKNLQDAIYSLNINASAKDLYQLIIDHLLLVRNSKNDEITKLKEALNKKEKEIEKISKTKSIFSALEPFPGVQNMNCAEDESLTKNKALEYSDFNDNGNDPNKKPYLIEISSIDNDRKYNNFKRSKNRINQCSNNKLDSTINNEIVNIEFFKYNDLNFNDAFIIHVEDRMKKLYSFYFSEPVTFRIRYEKRHFTGMIDSKTNERYSADIYTKLNEFEKVNLNNDQYNEMHAILFSRYFSNQITHGHSSISNKFSFLNVDDKYEFWLVENNNFSGPFRNNDQLQDAKKYMKIEITKQTGLFPEDIFINACFYSKINDRLIKKCFNENFGKNINLKQYIEVKTNN